MNNPQSSLEINSLDDHQDEINQVVNSLNNHYMHVRRPNEDNVLEFLDVEGPNMNVDVQNSPMRGSPLVIQSPQIEDRLIEEEVTPIQIDQEASDYKQPERIMSLQETIYHRASNTKPKQNSISSNTTHKHTHDQLIMLQDQATNVDSICNAKQLVVKKYGSLLQLWNCLYCVIYTMVLFEVSIQLLIDNDSNMYAIQFTVLTVVIYIIDMIGQYIVEQQFQYYSLGYRLIFLVFLIARVIDQEWWLNIPKVIEIYYLQKRISQLSIIANDMHLVYFTVFKIMLYFTLYAHIIGCLFYAISSTQNISWISSLNITDSDWQTKYTYALYWSFMNISLIGQNYITLHNQSEAIIHLILVLTMIIAYALLINTLYSLSFQYEYATNQLILDQYLNRRNIPQQLQFKVKRQLNQLWRNKSKQIDQENKITTQLSGILQQEVQLAMYSGLLTQIPFLKGISIKCRVDLTLSIKEVNYQEDQQLSMDGLYFCLEGGASYILPNGVPFKELQVGDFVGQQTLLTESPIPYILKTNSYTRLAYLSRDLFIRVLSTHVSDYQAYRMQLDSRLIDTAIKCAACNSHSHDVDQCPQLHYIPDRDALIQEHLYSEYAPRLKQLRHSRRTTNAKFGQRLFEDAASIFQENLNSEESEEKHHEQNAEPSEQFISIRKKSKSLDSNESKFQKSNSHQSLSAIPKPNGSALSSSFNVFKERKVSRQLDSDKVSSNSQNNKPHKSSSSSGRELPPVPVLVETQNEKYIDDSVLVAQQRNKKQQIGRMPSLRFSPQQQQVNLQAIPSVSEMISEDDQQSFLRQWSMSSKRQTPSQKYRQSSKFTGETNKQFQGVGQLEEVLEQFDQAARLEVYFPQDNYDRVIEIYKQYQNK